eukprot:TRINITY_DN12734_c0_g2_i1.p1 TRINITY_DN12734_c0_g2~~TRINITY_DN12734_c0_g2_i1.p1  ORF type:complete len:327 (-),score=24.73 TRINITY_DN12734_c0_g2_i1:201-1181(-)
MNEVTKSYALAKTEDNSGLLISPEKLNYPLPFAFMTPPKPDSLHSFDPSDVGLLRVHQRLSFSPPRDLHCEPSSLKALPLSFSPAQSSKTICPLLGSGVIRKTVTSRQIVIIKSSIMTINRPMHPAHNEPKTSYTNSKQTFGTTHVSGKSSAGSLRISIGSFNSINAEVSSTPKVVTEPLTRQGDASKAASKAKCCNCKKSKCLKLYCECFANGTFCQGCNCSGCYNTKDHGMEILEAKEIIGIRNPMGSKRHFSERSEETAISCNCSRSGCLKKYCQCFKAGNKCGAGCNCTECKNNTALRTILYGNCEGIIKRQKVETQCSKVL